MKKLPAKMHGVVMPFFLSMFMTLIVSAISTVHALRNPRGLPRLARIVAFLVGDRISGAHVRIAAGKKMRATRR